MKKNIAILLTICLCLSVVCVSAFTDDFYDDEEYFYDEEYYDDDYEYDEYEITCEFCEESFYESEIWYDEEGFGACPYCEAIVEGYFKEELAVEIWYEDGDLKDHEEYIVHIEASDPEAVVYYTLDRGYPSKWSKKYEEPFSVIGHGVVVRAIAYLDEEKSKVVNMWLKKDAHMEEEAFESDFEYEEIEEDKEYSNNLAEQKIEMTIGEKTIYVNGQPVEIDAEPIIYNERTMVPVRVIAEALGCDVKWDDATKTVIITQE